MKKVALVLGALLLITGCSVESSAGTTNSSSGSLTAVGYDKIVFENTSAYFSDYGNVDITFTDGTENVTNDVVAEYKYDSIDQKKEILDFIANGSVGTLTPKPINSEGYIVVIGFDKKEYHEATYVYYSGEVNIDLANGMEITTNNTVDQYQYKSLEQRQFIIDNYVKK